jgi:hypothetical protein
MDQEVEVARGHRTFIACVAAVVVAEVALATACTAVLGDWTLLLTGAGRVRPGQPGAAAAAAVRSARTSVCGPPASVARVCSAASRLRW